MKFKKARFLDGKFLFELKVLDETGRKLESWRVVDEDFPKLSRLLIKKYGIKKERDLDWAK